MVFADTVYHVRSWESPKAKVSAGATMALLNVRGRLRRCRSESTCRIGHPRHLIPELLDGPQVETIANAAGGILKDGSPVQPVSYRSGQ